MELIELYEYKVADVVADREPRGGARAFASLRDMLLKAPLETPLLQRMMAAERQYRAHMGIHEPIEGGGSNDIDSSTPKSLFSSLAAGTADVGSAETSTGGTKQGDYIAANITDVASTAVGTVGTVSADNSAVDYSQYSPVEVNSDTQELLSTEVPGGRLPAEQISVFGNMGLRTSGDTTKKTFLDKDKAHSDEERQAWQELSLLTWFNELHQKVAQVALEARNEPARPFLRTMYGTLKNVDRWGQNTVLKRIPDAQNQTLRLQDEQVIRDMARELCARLLTPEGRKRVVLVLDKLYEDPLPRQPDDTVAGEDVVPNPFERPLLRAAVSQVRELLDEFLVALPMVLDSTPPAGIIYPEVSETATLLPDDLGDEVVVHLGDGPRSVRWRSVVLTWQPEQDATGQDHWVMHVGVVAQNAMPTPSSRVMPPAQQIIRLYPNSKAADRIYTVRNGPLHLQVFLSGGYVLMYLRTQPEQELGLLAVQGRALSLMLKTDGDYAFLRLARALARYLRTGELDSQAHDNVQNYINAPVDALQAFVRKGLHTLTENVKLKEPQEIADSLLRCAHVLEMEPERAQSLHEALHNAAFNMESISEPDKTFGYQDQMSVNLNGVFHSFHLERLPLNIDLQEGRLMTIQKDYRDEMVALLPGHPAVLLDKMAAVHVGTLSVILVRHGQWLAVAAQTQVELVASDESNVDTKNKNTGNAKNTGNTGAIN